jgi:peptide/nickel transport system substrate-binding protein
MAQLRSGDIDFVNAVPAHELERVRSQPTVDLVVEPDRRYTYIGWNTRSPLFSEARVRRAMSMAIDAEAVLHTAVGGLGTLSHGPILSTMWAFNRSLERPPYDPQGAGGLLAELGWRDSDGDGVLDRDGTPFEFEILTTAETQDRRDACVLVAEQLARIGVTVHPRYLDWGALLEAQESGSFDAFVSGWREPTLIDLEEIWHSPEPGLPSMNFVGYANPEVDRLIVEANQAPTFTLQKPLFDRIQELIVADQPYTFLYESHRRSALNRRVHGADINAASPYFNLEDWWVDPASPAPG